MLIQDAPAKKLTTTPNYPIPLDSAYFAAVRERTHRIGVDIMVYRFRINDYRPLGVKFWSNEVAKLSGAPADTIERQINYLADGRYYRVLLWTRLSLLYRDFDPSLLAWKSRPMSSYLPNKGHPLWAPVASQIDLCLHNGQGVFG